MAKSRTATMLSHLCSLTFCVCACAMKARAGPGICTGTAASLGLTCSDIPANACNQTYTTETDQSWMCELHNDRGCVSTTFCLLPGQIPVSPAPPPPVPPPPPAPPPAPDPNMYVISGATTGDCVNGIWHLQDKKYNGKAGYVKQGTSSEYMIWENGNGDLDGNDAAYRSVSPESIPKWIIECGGAHRWTTIADTASPPVEGWTANSGHAAGVLNISTHVKDPSAGTVPWRPVLQYGTEYTATSAAVGSMGTVDAKGDKIFAKLSDSAINSLGPHADGFFYYRLYSPSLVGLYGTRAATSNDQPTLFIKSKNQFKDGEDCYNLCSDSTSAYCEKTWEECQTDAKNWHAQKSGARLDTHATTEVIKQGCKRWFHLAFKSHGCYYNPGNYRKGKICLSQGDCPTSVKALRSNVVISKLEGQGR
mmetsp:Transcript_44591/g.80178  ORF Transcript_44591/g.80178 Transcript_44591/m.80178 type:complete len:421 (+) Transcript_44591:94-1356(+)